MIIRALLFTLVVSAFPRAGAEIPKNLSAAKDAEYECRLPKTPEAAVARAMELHPHKYDKNKLACAADLMFAVTGMVPGDIDAHINALAVHTDYIDHIYTLMKFDIAGVQTEEWKIRLAHAVTQFNEISKRVESLAVDNHSARALKIIGDVLVNDITQPPEIGIPAMMKSRDELEKLVAGDGMLLGGLAAAILGRMYYELPVFYGGDVIKSIEIYQAVYQQAPKNILLLRFLAESYDQELEEEKAKRMLWEILALGEPAFADLQMTVDELKIAIGLASRLRDERLEEKLIAVRNKLLQQYPQLLTRRREAQMGHLGDNPLTGEKND